MVRKLSAGKVKVWGPSRLGGLVDAKRYEHRIFLYPGLSCALSKRRRY